MLNNPSSSYNDIPDFNFEDDIHYNNNQNDIMGVDYVTSDPDEDLMFKNDPIKWVKPSKYDNELIVYGFIRNIKPKTINNNSNFIPDSIKNMCCLYNFIDISNIFQNQSKTMKLFEITKKLFNESNFLLSKEICLQFINSNHSEKCSFYSLLAMIYSRMKLSVKAEKYYKLCIELEPLFDVYLWNYTTFLKKQSRYKESSVLLKKAIDLAPKDIPILFEYAKCLQLIDIQNDNNQNKYDYMSAYRSVTNSLSLRLTSRNPLMIKYQKDAKIDLYIAVAFKELGDLVECNKQYKKYLKGINIDLLTENTTAFGRLLFLLEKYDQALEMLEKALKKQTSNPFTYYYYAKIMKMKGKYVLSKEAFENALNLCDIFVDCQREYRLLLNEHF